MSESKKKYLTVVDFNKCITVKIIAEDTKQECVFEMSSDAYDISVLKLCKAPWNFLEPDAVYKILGGTLISEMYELRNTNDLSNREHALIQRAVNKIEEGITLAAKAYLRNTSD